MYNLQNTAIDEITIKRLLRLKSRNTEVSLRLTIPRIHRALHRKPSKEVLPDNTAQKVI